GRRAILERDSIPGEGQAAANPPAVAGPPGGPGWAPAPGGPSPAPEGATLLELVNRIPFAEVAPDTWVIPTEDVKELGNHLEPLLVEALASATPIVSMGGGVGLTLSTSLGSATLDRRGFEIQVGSLARRAGLKVGDRILFVNEQPVNSLGGLISIYRQLKRDAALSKVNVVIQRGNDLRTLTYHLR
ncbi:MAG: PDZ domain-containing protein, partial [Candidatus Methylomirabilales bacterium]